MDSTGIVVQSKGVFSVSKDLCRIAVDLDGGVPIPIQAQARERLLPPKVGAVSSTASMIRAVVLMEPAGSDSQISPCDNRSGRVTDDCLRPNVRDASQHMQ